MHLNSNVGLQITGEIATVKLGQYLTSLTLKRVIFTMT